LKKETVVAGRRKEVGRKKEVVVFIVSRSNFFFQFAGSPNRNVNVFLKALRVVEPVTN